MKKLIILSALLAMLVFVGTAGATTLTCDCYPSTANVQQFRVKINSGAYVNTPPVSSCGSGATANICTNGGVTMCYDVSATPVGAYTFVADAEDQWGWSADSVPLTGTRPSGPISSPTTLRLSIP